MRVAELDGVLLDYWVAKAEGFRESFAQFKSSPVPYSSNWTYGAPIIEREKMSTVKFGDQWGAFIPGGRADTSSDRIKGAGDYADGLGASALIAAMRAYVASKFGDEVEDVARSA